jgi:MYXO-CTERM domain-containing protein
VTHSFASAGAHAVTLRVTDDDGQGTTTTRTVQVAPAGTATPTEVPTREDGPGFGPVVGLLALVLLVAALARRRR